MYLGQFGFLWVLGRRFEIELTKSDSGEKDPLPIARVVESAWVQSGLLGGSGHQLSWTPLVAIGFCVD